MHLVNACQVGVIVGDSGLCCCTCVAYFDLYLTPLFVDRISTARWVVCLYSDLFISGLHRIQWQGWWSVYTVIYSLAGVRRITTARWVDCLYIDLFIIWFT